MALRHRATDGRKGEENIRAHLDVEDADAVLQQRRQKAGADKPQESNSDDDFAFTLMDDDAAGADAVAENRDCSTLPSDALKSDKEKAQKAKADQQARSQPKAASKPAARKNNNNSNSNSNNSSSNGKKSDSAANQASSNTAASGGNAVLGALWSVTSGVAGLAVQTVTTAASVTAGVMTGAAIGGVPGAVAGLAAGAAGTVAGAAIGTAKLGVKGVYYVGAGVVGAVASAVSRKGGNASGENGEAVAVSDVDGEEGDEEEEQEQVEQEQGASKEGRGKAGQGRNPSSGVVTRASASSSAAGNPSAGSASDTAAAAAAAVATPATGQTDAIKDSPNCTGCGAAFSFRLWRYACDNCRELFCATCLDKKYRHHVPRLKRSDAAQLCRNCYVSTCVQCCGGACFADWPVAELTAYLKDNDCRIGSAAVEKYDLMKLIFDHIRVESAVNARPEAVSVRSRHTGLDHLTVAQLRAALAKLGIDGSKCVEKHELIALLKKGCA